MEAYDPLSAPDSDEWQSMDEHERMTLVMDHHRQAHIELPNQRLHAVMHVVIENQVALGDTIPVQATVERLIDEGLDRHNAIHAVGTVLANFMQDLLDEESEPTNTERYYKELKKIGATKWLKEVR